MGWGLTVYGVDHHLLGLDLLDDFKPRGYIRLTGVVDALSLTLASHKQGLDDDVAVEGFHALYNLWQVVGAIGVVYLFYIGGVCGV